MRKRRPRGARPQRDEPGRWLTLAAPQGFGVPSRAVPNATRAATGGPLVSGAAFPSLSPLPSLQGVRVGALSCGASHVLCVDATGALWSWGAADGGRLGHGDIARRRSPVPVDALRGWRTLAASAGLEHSAAVAVPRSAPDAGAASAGTLFTWGSGRAYQLGQGPFVTSQLAPRAVEPLRRWRARVRAVACGAVHTACITASGAVLTWGDPTDGRLGRLPLEQARTAVASAAASFIALPDAAQRQLSRATHVYGGAALLRRGTPVVADPASAPVLLQDAGPGASPRPAAGQDVPGGSHLLCAEERARVGKEGRLREPGPWLAGDTAAPAAVTVGGSGGGARGSGSGSVGGPAAREAVLRRWLLTDPVVVAPAWLPAPMYGLGAETVPVRGECAALRPRAPAPADGPGRSGVRQGGHYRRGGAVVQRGTCGARRRQPRGCEPGRNGPVARRRRPGRNECDCARGQGCRRGGVRGRGRGGGGRTSAQSPSVHERAGATPYHRKAGATPYDGGARATPYHRAGVWPSYHRGAGCWHYHGRARALPYDRGAGSTP